MSLTGDFLRERKLKKKIPSNFQLNQKIKQVSYELESLLFETFKDNSIDRVMIEVDESVLPYFMDILISKFSNIYNFEQVGSNYFVFSKKILVM